MSAPAWLDEAKQRFIELEGVVKNNMSRHIPYRCPAGLITIGHGHNIESNGISDAAADLILEEDIRDAVNELDQRIPWWRDVPKPAGIVLFDLMMNMGWGDGVRGLSSFRSMLPAIRDGDYARAAELLLKSKYARDVKDRAKANAALLRSAHNG